MKLVILVIASDNLPIYADHQRLWRSYANAQPSISVYFIKQHENIQTPHFEGDTIWSPGQECLERVFDKTIDAFKLIPKCSYDYIIRTNLSSVWNFNNLIRKCKSLPSQGVFCGVLGNPGISGAGMIMSPDVVSMFVSHSHEIERGIWDDIDFGRLAIHCGVSCIPGYRYDPRSRDEVDQCWNLGYHFYLKDMRSGTRDVVNEIRVMRYLISKIQYEQES